MTTKTTTNPDALLERARAAMPGRDTIEAALADVAARLRQARATPRAEEKDVPARALAGVLAGQPIPDNLGEQVLTIRRDLEAANAEFAALRQLEADLRHRLRATHAEQADRAFAVLRDELDQLLDQARHVLAELGDVNDPAAAIEADRVRAWREATTLAARYTELRDAQLAIVTDARTPPDVPLGRTDPDARSLMRDHGHIRDAGAHGAIGDAATHRANTNEQQPTRRPWLTGDSLADLRFIATHEHVEAWVPDISELTAARDEHTQRLRDEARAAEQPPTRAISRQSRPPVAFLPDPDTDERTKA